MVPTKSCDTCFSWFPESQEDPIMKDMGLCVGVSKDIAAGGVSYARMLPFTEAKSWCELYEEMPVLPKDFKIGGTGE
jgi:hypothetical protein